jgi:hydroxyacylglutathione hydrolase
VRIPLRLSNVHVIQARRPVLVDAGTIGDMADLQVALDDRKIRFRDLALVLLTHGHADHSGLAFDLRRLSGATVMMGAADIPLAQKGENDVLRPTSFTASLLKPFITSVYPSFEPDVAVRAGADVDLRPWGIEGKAIAMPGHTAGSVVVVLSDNSAFVGDMMMGGSFGGAIFPSSPGEHYYHADREQNRRNIKTLLDRGVEKFYLGHGGPVMRADVMAAFSGG